MHQGYSPFTFNASDIPNVEATESIRNLQRMLEQDTRKITISMSRERTDTIEFVKELCKLAKETAQAEKDLQEAVQEKSPQAALTELFLELKTDQTPAVVERIVADIDAIVRVVSFAGWQKTSSGEREVQKSLRQALLKYQLHKDQVLFDRAYGYIKEYY